VRRMLFSTENTEKEVRPRKGWCRGVFNPDSGGR
jgi:hypothetical protein